MIPAIKDPNNLPSYHEMADCLLYMAQSLLTIRENVLQMEAFHTTKDNSISHIIEESVREIPQEELNLLFQIPSDSYGSGQPVASVICPLPAVEELENIARMANLLSHGAFQSDVPPSRESSPKTRQICDLEEEIFKKINEDSLSPKNSLITDSEDSPVLFTDTEDYALLGSDRKMRLQYECDVCCRKFSNKSLLKKHIFTHSGRQPYVCDLCYRSFNRKDNLARHRRTPHDSATASPANVKSPCVPLVSKSPTVSKFQYPTSSIFPTKLTPNTDLKQYLASVLCRKPSKRPNSTESASSK